MGRLASCHTTSSSASFAFPDFVNDSALDTFVRVTSCESDRQGYCASPQSIFEKSKTTADENQVGNLSSHKNSTQFLHSFCKAAQTLGQGRLLYKHHASPTYPVEKSLSEIWNLIPKLRLRRISSHQDLRLGKHFSSKISRELWLWFVNRKLKTEKDEIGRFLFGVLRWKATVWVGKHMKMMFIAE